MVVSPQTQMHKSNTRQRRTERARFEGENRRILPQPEGSRVTVARMLDGEQARERPLHSLPSPEQSQKKKKTGGRCLYKQLTDAAQASQGPSSVQKKGRES